MLKLQAFTKYDAAFVCLWPQNKTEFNWWTAGKLGEFPIQADKLLSFYLDKTNRFCGIFSVFDDIGLCGHFTLRYCDDTQTSLRLGFIILNPDRRGRGYGKEMLKLALNYIDENYPNFPVSLGVFEDNEPAIHCYEAMGFRFTSETEETPFDSEYKIMQY